MASCGLVRLWGGLIAPIRSGDMAGIALGERPGHGASATTSKTHTAIRERLEGRSIDWNERVSDEQY